MQPATTALFGLLRLFLFGGVCFCPFVFLWFLARNFVFNEFVPSTHMRIRLDESFGVFNLVSFKNFLEV